MTTQTIALGGVIAIAFAGTGVYISEEKIKDKIEICHIAGEDYDDDGFFKRMWRGDDDRDKFDDRDDKGDDKKRDGRDNDKDKNKRSDSKDSDDDKDEDKGDDDNHLSSKDDNDKNDDNDGDDSKKSKWRVIKISQKAWTAHEAHGDKYPVPEGGCDADPVPPTPTEPPTNPPPTPGIPI
ncbi:hypothetical protein ACFL6I_10935 [candidate division KSB1 bacterium]